jgi:hypothetical protein
MMGMAALARPQCMAHRTAGHGVSGCRCRQYYFVGKIKPYNRFGQRLLAPVPRGSRATGRLLQWFSKESPDATSFRLYIFAHTDCAASIGSQYYNRAICGFFDAANYRIQYRAVSCRGTKGKT